MKVVRGSDRSSYSIMKGVIQGVTWVVFMALMFFLLVTAFVCVRGAWQLSGTWLA